VPPEVKTPGWTPLITETKIVYAINGQLSQGQGNVYVTGNDGPDVWVVFTDNTYNKKDSVKARLLNYYYEDITIVVKCATSNIGVAGYCEVPGGITLSTDNDTTLYVLGKCSDGTCDGKGSGWELVPGDWDRDGGLTTALTTPPKGAGSWTLDPSSTGEGYVTVTRPGPEGTTLTAEVPVKITAGAPDRAALVIITPPDLRIAGQPIQFEVKYYNSIGEMREWNSSWVNDSAYFKDILQGLGVTTVEPKIVDGFNGEKVLFYVDGKDGRVNAKLKHDLVNGKDIVTITIYNAADGKDHQIQYKETINGKGLEAVSDRFTVLPGAPTRIIIEGPGIDSSRTLTVNQSDDPLLLHAVAVDEWGNRVGDYPSNWNATNPIPVNEPNRPVIVYVPGKAEDNGCGQLVVIGVANPSLKDSIKVCVKGVTTRPVSAITRDADGCGYLDKIEMKFKKPIYFEKGETTARKNPTTNEINVKYNSFAFTVDSVTVNTQDSTVTIWLHDVAPHSGEFQTSWLPTINIGDGFLMTKLDGDVLDPVLGQTIKEPVVSDGAAPVIATAKLFMQDNHIEVRFSEKVKPASYASFLAAGDTRLPPDILFNIWLKRGENVAQQARTRALIKKRNDPNEGGVWDLQVGKLSGIDKVIRKDDYTLRFDLKEGMKIDPKNDYINIRTSDPNQEIAAITPITEVRGVSDRVDLGVEPKANNRKVLITPEGEPNGVMRPVPNPASPDDSRLGTFGTASGGTTTKPITAGKIYALNDLTALEQVRGSKDPVTGKYKPGEKGGAVFAVPIYVPEQGYVKCQLKVYDLAGNLVISAESGKNENAAAGVKPEMKGLPTATDIHLYWNGYNSKAMKVAPGTYRIVVKISYPEDGNLSSKDKQYAKEKKFTGLLGMSK